MKKSLVLIGILGVVAAVMAATNDVTVGGSAFPTTAKNKAFVIENTATFSTTYASATGDVMKVLNVPADTVVSFVEYKVLTTNLISATFDIGDGGSLARWKSDADASTIGAVLGTATPYLYTTADTIDIHVDQVISGGTVRVRAFCVDVSQ